MSYAAVVRILGWLVAGFGATMLVPAAFAVIAEESQSAVGFAGGAPMRSKLKGPIRGTGEFKCVF